MAGAVFISFVIGALALVPVEMIAVGGGPGLAWTTGSLLLALGLMCGVCAAASDTAARAFEGREPQRGWRAGPAALIRALAAAPVLVFVSHRLFDGGYAATLPGASTAHLWLPAVGCAVVAAGLWAGRYVLAGRPGARRAAGVGLVGLAVAIEYANRTSYRSEYPDVHAALIVGSASALGLAVVLTAAPLSRSSRAFRLAVCAAVSGAIVATTAGALAWGLSDPDDRWAVATRGTHTRHLARLWRAALDRDGDGYARVLGGGDCDDGDPQVSPAALDTPGDGRDQDCDGRDAEPVPVARPAVDYETALSEWRTRDEVRDVLARTRHMHIALIMVDALRADALADTADNRAEYPRLFELADASRRFDRAFSPASGTDVAIAALLTARYAPLAPIEATLIEAIRGTGRKTGAVLPREVTRWAGEALLTRGLDHWQPLVTDAGERDVGRRSSGADTTRLGLAFVDRVGAGADPSVRDADTPPWFVWLHYFDVHEHHQLDADDPRLRAALGGRSDPSRAERYRATVALVDAEVGRVIDALRARELWDRTVVVLASDHGESLGEDPRLPDAHGRVLYTPLVHIPLLVRVPGVPPAVVEQPVSLVDLSRTLIELAGADDAVERDGRSLLPFLVDGAPPVVTAHAPPFPLHESDQHGVIAWPHVLLVRPADNLVEVYNLADDPHQRRDLSGDPALTGRLRHIYKQLPAQPVDRTRAARAARERMFRAPRDQE